MVVFWGVWLEIIFNWSMIKKKTIKEGIKSLEEKEQSSNRYKESERILFYPKYKKQTIENRTKVEGLRFLFLFSDWSFEHPSLPDHRSERSLIITLQLPTLELQSFIRYGIYVMELCLNLHSAVLPNKAVRNRSSAVLTFGTDITIHFIRFIFWLDVKASNLWD